MLAALAARQKKAEKHNANMSNKKYAKKFSEKMKVTAHVEGGFSAMFSSNEEKENWLKTREEAKRQSHSSFY